MAFASNPLHAFCLVRSSFYARLGDVVELISTIAGQTAKAIGEIGEPISGIQSATRESVGATAEISGPIERQSDISSTIAAEVLSTAQSLSSDSNRLKLDVGKFLNSCRLKKIARLR